MLVADYTGHNILKVDMQTKAISTYAHESRMNQPNDIALAPGGNLYASDPDWPNQKGQLWLITPDGKVTLLESDMGTTNGIDVSPDGKKLYVNESAQLKVWIYDIKPDGTLKNKRLFHTFEGFGMDGIRCDVKGNPVSLPLRQRNGSRYKSEGQADPRNTTERQKALQHHIRRS